MKGNLVNDELKSQLIGAGVSETAIATLIEQELITEAALQGTTYEQFTALGIKAGSAKILAGRYAPPPAPPTSAPVTDEIPEGAAPSTAQVNQFATSMGIDPNMLSMFMFANMGAGAGLDMDLSGFLPVGQIVAGYNPKRRDMSYMIMGQIERRLDVPGIVVINADGGVNPTITAKFINELEDGFPFPDDGVYYGEDGNPYEIIKVGVDAQGIYDADPVDSSRALPQNGIGIGRVRWNGVIQEVREVVWFATQTGELTPNDDATLSWLAA
jgi:hypothetical protein